MSPNEIGRKRFFLYNQSCTVEVNPNPLLVIVRALAGWFVLKENIVLSPNPYQKIELAANYIQVFQAIVERNFSALPAANDEFLKREQEYLDCLDQDKKESLLYRFALQANLVAQYCIEIIVFSAMLLEAAINDIGIRYIKQEFFSKNIEPISSIGKITLVFYIAAKIEIDTGGSTFQALQQLFKLRNKLVHGKTIRAGADESAAIDSTRFRELAKDHYDVNWLKEAENAINALCEFQKLANKLEDAASMRSVYWEDCQE